LFKSYLSELLLLGGVVTLPLGFCFSAACSASFRWIIDNVGFGDELHDKRFTNTSVVAFQPNEIILSFWLLFSPCFFFSQ
jgi:hypothetical protein